jgi:autotransporter-associated beta strand protein
VSTSIAAWCAVAALVHAGNTATWLASPKSNDWNSSFNWTPSNVPDVDGEFAAFGSSSETDPVVTQDITISGITFLGGAPAYNILNTAAMQVRGPGIVNNSSNVQTITNGSSIETRVFVAGSANGKSIGAPGLLEFFNSASAGNAVLNNAAPVSIINFFNNSTAANSTINNSDPTAVVNFFDNATAGNSTINNSGSDSIPSSIVGFFGSATAGNSIINNSGDSAQILFSNSSTAGGATINNSGFGAVVFIGVNATAGTAIINNSGDTAGVAFDGNSSAASATINNSGLVGLVEFYDNSTAGNSTINNTSATGLVNFFDNATAANAIINNNGSGPFPSSVVGFFGNSTAGSASISNNGANSQTLFSDNSTAGNSVIINNGDGSSIAFGANATGGTATLINANNTAVIDISQLDTSGISVGSIAGNGTLALGSKSLTTGLNNTSTTFSGVIADGGFQGGTGGSLVKVGAGTLVLSGANTYTGGTTLQGGAIVVASDSALGTGDFLLTDGALAASIPQGLSVSRGHRHRALAPGAGPFRDINVGGNYTQTGGELDLRIGGRAAGQFDRLVVLGRANLGGRLRVDAVDGFRPVGGDKFEVITAGSGVAGTFASLEDRLTPSLALRLQVNYLPNSVILEYIQGSVLQFAKTKNQRAVAAALDEVLAEIDATPIIDALGLLDPDDIPAALDAIAPEEFASFLEIARSGAKIQAANVEHRLDEIHDAAFAPPQTGYASDGKSAKDMKQIPAPPPPFGFFVNGSGEFVDVGGTGNAAGYDFEAGGVTIGLDYKLNANCVIGALFNYTRVSADLDFGGDIDVDSVRGGLYASLFSGGAYLNAFVGGGYNDYDTSRRSIGGHAHGDTDAGEFNLAVSAGYDWHFGSLVVGPFASFQYTYLDVGGFDERGSLAPLRIGDWDGDSVRSYLGVRLSTEVPVGSMMLTPELRLAWQHEYGDVEPGIPARFAFGGPQFTTFGPELGRDSFIIRAGFSLAITPTFATYAWYDGELGRSNYDAHNVVVGGRLNF